MGFGRVVVVSAPPFVLNVFFHEIDTRKHPDHPPGWRWAVHAGEDPTAVETCLQAGWAHDRNEAMFFGHQTAAAVVNGFKFIGIPVAPFDPIPLTSDPTPSRKN